MASVRPPDLYESLILIRDDAAKIKDLIEKRGQPVCQCIPEIQQKATNILHLIDNLRIEAEPLGFWHPLAEGPVVNLIDEIKKLEAVND